MKRKTDPKTLKRIEDIRAQGFHAKEIAEKLNQEGIRTQRGREWKSNNVQNFLPTMKIPKKKERREKFIDVPVIDPKRPASRIIAFVFEEASQASEFFHTLNEKGSS